MEKCKRTTKVSFHNKLQCIFWTLETKSGPESSTTFSERKAEYSLMRNWVVLVTVLGTLSQQEYCFHDWHEIIKTTFKFPIWTPGFEVSHSLVIENMCKLAVMCNFTVMLLLNGNLPFNEPPMCQPRLLGTYESYLAMVPCLLWQCRFL